MTIISKKIVYDALLTVIIVKVIRDTFLENAKGNLTITIVAVATEVEVTPEAVEVTLEANPTKNFIRVLE